jgi:uncharacterized protein (TIGR03382 family)
LVGLPFIVTGSTSVQLSPGQVEVYDVKCQTPTNGDHADSLTFTRNPGNVASVVPLACKGITSTVAIDPRPVLFAPALVGAPPPDVTLTIQNTTGSTVTLSAKLSQSADSDVTILSGPSDNAMVGAGVTVPVILHYSAAHEHDAGPLGGLIVTVDGTPQNVAIVGEAKLGAIATTPASVEFGPICAGTEASQQVGVYASASAEVEVMSFNLATGAQFQVSSSAPNFTLQPRRGNEPTVTVKALATTPGDFTDSFVIHNNVPDQSTLEVPVHAEVQAMGIAPSPAIVNFGVAEVGSTTFANEVVLTNCSGSPLTITGAAVESIVPGEFALVFPAAAVLQPREKYSMLLVMNPKANGNRTGSLVIQHDGGAPTVVPLEGDGFGVEEVDRETYYACAATSGGSAWPVLLVIFGLRRRRRR